MNTLIHSTAIVEKGAQLGVGVEVGPWSLIGAMAKLGDRTVIGPHCVVRGRTTMGPDNTLVSHVALGNPPQDLKYAGEPTELIIGAGNTVREFATMNLATVQGGGKTIVGDRNLFMTQSHIAHDCKVGSDNIFANAGTLAGHVTIGNCITLGAFSAVHQFCRVGDYAFIGGFTVVTRDALPFMKTVGSRGDAKSFGPNSVGLARRGFSKEAIAALASAHKRLNYGDDLLAEKLAAVENEFGKIAEVRQLIDFIKGAQRGIILG